MCLIVKLSQTALIRMTVSLATTVIPVVSVYWKLRWQLLCTGYNQHHAQTSPRRYPFWRLNIIYLIKGNGHSRAFVCRNLFTIYIHFFCCSTEYLTCFGPCSLFVWPLLFLFCYTGICHFLLLDLIFISLYYVIFIYTGVYLFKLERLVVNSGCIGHKAVRRKGILNYNKDCGRCVQLDSNFTLNISYLF